VVSSVVVVSNGGFGLPTFQLLPGVSVLISRSLPLSRLPWRRMVGWSNKGERVWKGNVIV
jgi:hypothetical protein